MGLDHDFNPRRLERYLLTAWESGATPVVLLSKADLVTNASSRVKEIESLAPGGDAVLVGRVGPSPPGLPGLPVLVGGHTLRSGAAQLGLQLAAVLHPRTRALKKRVRVRD